MPVPGSSEWTHERFSRCLLFVDIKWRRRGNDQSPPLYSLRPMHVCARGCRVVLTCFLPCPVRSSNVIHHGDCTHQCHTPPSPFPGVVPDNSMYSTRSGIWTSGSGTETWCSFPFSHCSCRLEIVLLLACFYLTPSLLLHPFLTIYTCCCFSFEHSSYLPSSALLSPSNIHCCEAVSS